MQSTTIEKTCVQLLLKEPFYGHFLMGVPKAFSAEIETACVALYQKQMVKLMINEAFWTTLSSAHQYGLIKHEVLHIVLKHLTLFPTFSNKKIFNIAADLVVNQFILTEQLPNGAVTLDFFKPLQVTHQFFLLPNQGTDYYYEKLMQLLNNQYTCNSSCNEVEKEAAQSVIDTLNRWLQEGCATMKQHDFWSDFDKMDSSELRVFEEYVKNLTKQTVQRIKQKGWGNLPGGLIELLEELVAETPQVNWRRALRLFAATSNSTFVKNTIRRPSRRYGTTPGTKIKRRNQLALAIDTSGSVSIEELNLFFNEIYFIWRQGATITVLECDTQIQKIYPYKGKLPEGIHGRGGTDFNEPIRWANEHLPDALIYFTDGEAPAPHIEARIPVLWVITNAENRKFEQLKDRKIFLN
ncbi:MAG: hypothetical protein RLZZ292_1451 [Bacteroidota bacterium]|jgi:predicted metal-dependent peptidase